MVMHARKPQRISDGYFEKHQTHPYQNAKYSSSKANYTERYNHERIRDSPNGNSFSPDSASPRDRTYQNKLYVQKIREKERDRDYKTSRDKYAECTRSPKDKRSRDSEHRTNHDRSNAEERPPRVGDWTEHISSSGKKYYYNCKTEVSQWEKPKEWLERTRFKEKERADDRGYFVSSSRLGHDKHSNSRASNSSSSTGGSKLKRDDYWNNQSSSRDTTIVTNEQQQERRKQQIEGEDMDISPGDSTPTSERSYPHSTGVTVNNTPQQLVASSPSNIPPVTTVTTCNVPGPPPVSMVIPPSRLLSQLTGSKSLAEQMESFRPTGNELTVTQPLQVDTTIVDNVVVGSDGPPTPTHSETQDCVVNTDPRKLASPPNSLSSLQSLSATNSSALQALRQQTPHLTPSLANYYRDDLGNHVRGWPADVLEKQSQKLSEESFSLTSLQCTRVSAELKTARSIVRLTEIHSTLNEQRILFLRQQIKTLEELNTQHSFMGEDT